MDLGTLADNLSGISLNAHFPGGRVIPIGRENPVIDWHLSDERLLRQILRRPFHRLERSYLRGHWNLDTRYLPDLIQAFARAHQYATRSIRLSAAGDWARRCLMRRDRALPSWQDSGLWLARACLGEELLQGCAHYREPGIGQEQAQRLRSRDLCTQLQLAPQQHLLDLSAGWGATALSLAQQTGVRVTGLVATEEQLRHARHEAHRRGLSAIVTFHLRARYHHPDRFDRIIANDSIDPVAHAHRLVPELTGLLQETGLAWMQFRARPHASGVGVPADAAATVPTLSRLHEAVEKSPLRALQLLDLSADRANDLRRYAARLRQQHEPARRYFGEPLARAWEWHIASELAALGQGHLSQYEVILGNHRCRWHAGGNPYPGVALPLAITEKIPGLAQNL